MASTARASLGDHLPTGTISREDERELAARAHDGEEEALRRLIGAHYGAVVKIARRYQNSSVSMDDLIDEGVIGLIEAVRRYDPDRDNKFLTYAVWWIRRSMVRYLSEGAALVRVPRYRSRQFKDATRAAAELGTRLGRAPRIQEVARALDCSPQEAARRLRAYPRRVSLDQPPEGWDRPLSQVFEDPSTECQEEAFLLREDLKRLRRALEDLPERESFILRHRFGLEGCDRRTLRELAAEMDISKERVRQLESQACDRLARILG